MDGAAFMVSMLAPSTSKLSFSGGESPVINAIAPRRSASAVPARDARTSTRASRRGVVVDGIGAFGTRRVSESRSSAPGDAAPLTGRTRRSAASLEVRDAHFDSSCFESGLSRLRGKTGTSSRVFSRHSTDRTGELLAPCLRAPADRDRAVCPTSLPRRIIINVTSDDESGETMAVTLTQRNLGAAPTETRLPYVEHVGYRC